GSAHDPFSHGQNLGTILGSVLRIDIDHKDPGLAYAIPKDNPFVGRPGARGEIWAYGVRNIWRLAFDRKTGDLWAGDVGQNRYEEVDIITRGGNYGWKIREGKHPFDPEAEQTGGPLIEPLVDYFHSEGRSVTGGVVYRGMRLPEYEGAYFYADFVSGNVWILRYDGKKVTEHRKVCRSGLPISAFGEDPQGEMYVTAFDGRIHRFVKVETDLEAIREAFPKKLSDTGFFVPGKGHTPVPGLIPYQVQVPLWSDHADKLRYIALPKSRSVGFQRQQYWDLPEGSVIVKTFLMNLDRVAGRDPKLLETRLLVHSPAGWAGYTYVWNDEETEAYLIDGAQTKELTVRTAEGPMTQQWYFPSREDCLSCHTRSTKFVLGLNTRQFNGPAPDDASVNQIERLARLQVFAKDPPPPSRLDAYPHWETKDGTVDALARAYLDANCAMCHAKGALRAEKPDFSYYTPLKQTLLVNRKAGQGQLGPENSRLITPGSPELSEVYHRMAVRGQRQMPPLATNLPDKEALEVLRKWIEQL
ncbi:MAG: PQQ-dependent sugar dehydrogenase, partial [Planctomycetota bacterium]